MYSQISTLLKEKHFCLTEESGPHCPSQLLLAVLGKAFLYFCSLVAATAGPPASDGDCRHFLSHPSWWGCLLFMIISLHSSLSFWAGIQKQISTSIFSSQVSSLRIHTCPFPLFIRQKPVSTDGPYSRKERKNKI